MSDERVVIAVDCSTTGAKASVWNVHGAEVASGRAELDLSIPAPGRGEQDPRQWWTAMQSAVRSAVAGLDLSRVVSLTVTHQRESFVCLDDDGEAVRPAMLWLDSRAGEQVDRFGSADIHDRTGKPPNTTVSYYKLLWMAEHEPENLRRTAHVVEVHGYLVHCMTDLWATSTASMDPTGLVDIRTGDYDPAVLTHLGLDRSQLSTLHFPGDVIGGLTVDAAELLGLLPGTLIVAGAGDGQCAGLGAGVAAPGRAYLNIGTGLISGTYSSQYQPDRAYRAMLGTIPGSFTYETFVGAGTYMISWFIDTFTHCSEEFGGGVEATLESEAAVVPRGSDGLYVVPYWNGALTPYWDHEARGIMVGLQGVHRRAHIYRAVLEGVAFELRLSQDQVEQATGDTVEEFVAMGGGSQCPLWCQIIADVLRRPVVLSRQRETTCLGAGMLAAFGAGLFPSIRHAAEAMSATEFRYEPDPKAADDYEALYRRYAAIYPAFRSFFHDRIEVMA
ncbi:FGGY-family carbohydrate kinase [Cryobacterium sp. Hb1]|uniref:xylulokinase n=1 Tax=Cryobacterium sp. Hb1 TaxID=1259147 RepID=UPI00106D993B|nr:FGGY-family carbohydrate kinase [Cryobacterium sp. Hb1]TFD69636.1 carbohydrate kinase [Cryobacterium sp. Hb1]